VRPERYVGINQRAAANSAGCEDVGLLEH
jgi:hypothetical protein